MGSLQDHKKRDGVHSYFYNEARIRSLFCRKPMVKGISIMTNKSEALQKKKPVKKKSNAGRKTVMTKEVLRKLDECFLNDLSDRQACYIVDINPESLYAYQREHPKYTERKATLKEMVKAKAKMVIAKTINSNDINTAKWYAEHKMQSEFSTKQEIAGSGGFASAVTVEFI